LENHIDIPFPFEAVDKLMLPKVIKRKIRRIWRGRKSKLDDRRVGWVIETPVRGGEQVGSMSCWKGGNQVKKRGQTEG
jgi:hypothetical protein